MSIERYKKKHKYSAKLYPEAFQTIFLDKFYDNIEKEGLDKEKAIDILRYVFQWVRDVMVHETYTRDFREERVTIHLNKLFTIKSKRKSNSKFWSKRYKFLRLQSQKKHKPNYNDYGQLI